MPQEVSQNTDGNARTPTEAPAPVRTPWWSRLRGAVPWGHRHRMVGGVMALAALIAGLSWPLMGGLDADIRYASHVGDRLIPAAHRIADLDATTTAGFAALEHFLLTRDAAERERFTTAMARSHVMLTTLETAVEDLPQDAARIGAEMVRTRKLLRLVETQAHQAFSYADRPDNVTSAFLLTRRGDPLLERTHRYIEMILNSRSGPVVSGRVGEVVDLLGYEASLNRMMADARGYLILREGRFRARYTQAETENGARYARVQNMMASEDEATRALWTLIEASRAKLLTTLDAALASRDSTAWRRDLDFYQRELLPSVGALQASVLALSSLVRNVTDHVVAEHQRHGRSMHTGVMVGILCLLLACAAGGEWIRRRERRFARDLAAAGARLDQLADRVRHETDRHADEAACQADEIGEVFRAICDFKGTLTQIRDQSTAMAQQTDAAGLECMRGMEVLNDSQARMEAILAPVREISEAMEKTMLQTRQMNGILAVLDELADQTKLLSFNATIEAAGAGEAGQRFGMVARHVRRLSTRAQEATGEVRDMIKQVQGTTDATRAATERGTSAVAQGEDLMNVVVERLDLIVEAVTLVADVSGDIARATQSQEASLARVDQFTAQARATATHVADRTVQRLDTAQELKATAAQLAGLVGR